MPIVWSSEIVCLGGSAFRRQSVYLAFRDGLQNTKGTLIKITGSVNHMKVD